jgi:hypothetical protein
MNGPNKYTILKDVQVTNTLAYWAHSQVVKKNKAL